MGIGGATAYSTSDFQEGGPGRQVESPARSLASSRNTLRHSLEKSGVPPLVVEINRLVVIPQHARRHDEDDSGMREKKTLSQEKIWLKRPSIEPLFQPVDWNSHASATEFSDRQAIVFDQSLESAHRNLHVGGAFFFC